MVRTYRDGRQNHKRLQARLERRRFSRLARACCKGRTMRRGTSNLRCFPDEHRSLSVRLRRIVDFRRYPVGCQVLGNDTGLPTQLS